MLLLQLIVKLLVSFNIAYGNGGEGGILSPSFSWRNEENQIVKLSDFIGKNKNIALSMIYTECKKTCPMATLKTLKDVESEFKKRNLNLEIVLITFDPEVDTPEVLLKFKKKLSLENNWHLLTGSKDDTRSLAKMIGLGEYWKMDDHILHGYKIVLLNEQGETNKVLDWNHSTIF